MRLECPSCGSSTGLGEYKCFKCGAVDSSQRYCQARTPKGVAHSLPDGTTFRLSEFSIEARQWLQVKCNLTDRQIREQSIAYIPSSNKIYIPAIDFDTYHTTKFYQLRALNEGDIKYLTHGKPSEFQIHYRDFPGQSSVVIVEDHISAIRLRKHCNVLALSGTSINKNEIAGMLETYDTFIFWLDPDDAGQAAQRKIESQLVAASDTRRVRSLFTNTRTPHYIFISVDNHQHTKDPKTYLDSEIKDILCTSQRLQVGV